LYIFAQKIKKLYSNDFPDNQLANFRTVYTIKAFDDDRLTWKYMLQLNNWRGPIDAWPL